MGAIVNRQTSAKSGMRPRLGLFSRVIQRYHSRIYKRVAMNLLWSKTWRSFSQSWREWWILFPLFPTKVALDTLTSISMDMQICSWPWNSPTKPRNQWFSWVKHVQLRHAQRQLFRDKYQGDTSTQVTKWLTSKEFPTWPETPLLCLCQSILTRMEEWILLSRKPRMVFKAWESSTITSSLTHSLSRQWCCPRLETPMICCLVRWHQEHHLGLQLLRWRTRSRSGLEHSCHRPATTAYHFHTFTWVLEEAITSLKISTWPTR